jgi:putative ABC transport system permease protein
MVKFHWNSVYYLELGWRHLKKRRWLGSLMILAIGIGIATCMTTLTVRHVLARDPLPNKGTLVVHVQIERRTGEPIGQEPLDTISYQDAQMLLIDKHALRQTATGASEMTIYPETGAPYIVGIRLATADFFRMFRAPWLYGTSWGTDGDEEHQKAIVLSAPLSERLFGVNNPVGKIIKFGTGSFRVVGVLQDWRPAPRFYDLSKGTYIRPEEAYIPLTTGIDIHLPPRGSMTCWGPISDPTHLASAPCAWLQYWAELNRSDRSSYYDYVGDRTATSSSGGPSHPSIRVRTVTEWLAFKHVIPEDANLQLILAAIFLTICIVNAGGLIMAGFVHRTNEIAIRRALGATRRDIYLQVTTEVATIGALGGVVGILLSLGGLALVKREPVAYADLASMDLQMLLVALLLPFPLTLAMAAWPAWRACNVPPSLYLKAE